MTDPKDGRGSDDPSDDPTTPPDRSDPDGGGRTATPDDARRDSGSNRRRRADSREDSRARRNSRNAAGRDGPSGLLGWFKWFWTTDTGAAVYVRDVVTSVAFVLLIGLVLFGISGIWPPMVAVESGSMEPNMEEGDLIFIVDNERFTPAEAVEHDERSTGVVPADTAQETDRVKFGQYGDVIVFMPDGSGAQTPIIHRAMLWVDADEDWYDRANEGYLGNADDCDDLAHCPAPHAGFITLGDANSNYDQVGENSALSAPVQPDWILGTAELRVPYLGHIRLTFSTQFATGLEQGVAPDPAAAQTSPETPETSPSSADSEPSRSEASATSTGGSAHLVA